MLFSYHWYLNRLIKTKTRDPFDKWNSNGLKMTCYGKTIRFQGECKYKLQINFL